ncbi:MAG: acetyl-CoA carboxylase biotin carboxyl carrier protein [Eubacterium sp.]|nr:acetyl-CoA carboxylase biotin carboxyl carrier protein [Eubacterium sp.]
MDISLKDIEDLIERFEKGSLKSLELETDAFRLAVEKETAKTYVKEAFEKAIPQKAEVLETASPAEEIKPDGREVKAPLVGTFYSSPSPGKDAYVSVGKRVKKGDTLGLIEAMKIMNEIVSPADGIVEEILVENADFVAFDQTLFVIKEDA